MKCIRYETCKNGCYETGVKEITDEEYEKLLKKGEEKMSVPAYERQTSTMEFITKARDLLRYTVVMCSKIPKRYTFYGVIHTYNYAQDILDKLILANSLNLKTYYQKRTELLDEALGLLACLSNHLDLIRSYVQLEDKKWVRWATLIGICEKLIKGVKARDKTRLGAQLKHSGFSGNNRWFRSPYVTNGTNFCNWNNNGYVNNNNATNTNYCPL